MDSKKPRRPRDARTEAEKTRQWIADRAAVQGVTVAEYEAQIAAKHNKEDS